MAINIHDLMAKANNVTNLTSGIGTGGTSKMSLTVVYNRNGKRIEMNRKLAETLKLADTAQISFVPEEGIVLLGKYLTDDTDKCIQLTLKDEYDKIKERVTGKKIAYSAEASFSVASNFGIDFSKITSKSFSGIEIDDSNPDTPVAVITIARV